MSNITNNPVVDLADVRKTYRVRGVEVPAVNGVSFEISRQRFSMIVGPSSANHKSSKQR